MGIVNQFVEWVMEHPCRQMAMFGMMAGMFLMFSILTGYWVILESIKRFIRRHYGKNIQSNKNDS